MKKGYIKITDDLYKSEWDKIYIFIKDFRPTNIEFRNGVWYLYGESELFDELIEGQDVPQYDVYFHANEDGSIKSYEFKKSL